jgi:uncharacterized protein YraI
LLAAITILTAIPFVAAPQAAQAASTAVTTDYLNLRSGPRTDMRIRAVMPPGETVELLGGTRRGFYKVSWNGQPGWAHGDYLDFDGSSGGGGGGADRISPAVAAADGRSSIRLSICGPRQARAHRSSW